MWYNIYMINRKEFNQEKGILTIDINNGDYKALKAMTERLGFNSEESTLRYLLAVLNQSATTVLTITDTNGIKKDLSPNESLLNENK